MLRKITDKENIAKARERRNKKLVTIIAFILLASMILSTIAYLAPEGARQEEQEIIYNNIKFLLDENSRWNFNYAGNDYALFFNPLELKNISIKITDNLQTYYGKTVYFAFDTGDPFQYGISEIETNLNRFVRFNSACLNANCSFDYPFKSCDKDNVIVFKTENISKIEQKENCIFISYKDNSDLKSTDAFIYKILGI